MSTSRRSVQRLYSDPSAAYDVALRWQSCGLKTIIIKPTTIKGQRRYALTATATDEQVRACGIRGDELTGARRRKRRR